MAGCIVGACGGEAHTGADGSRGSKVQDDSSSHPDGGAAEEAEDAGLADWGAMDASSSHLEGGTAQEADNAGGASSTDSSTDAREPRPARGDDGSVDSNACQPAARGAERISAPVDVVWVIDGSGSMADEAQRVRDNVEDFADSIATAGFDARVVLLAGEDLVPADSMLVVSSRYRFVQHDVDSHNALESIVSRYADYSDLLRPTSHPHFIIVTDDESAYRDLASPVERAQAFQDDLGALLQRNYAVHAIVSPGMWGAPPCVPPLPDPALEQCCMDYLDGGSTAVPAGCEPYAEQVTPTDCPYLVPPLSLTFLGGAFANGETYGLLASETDGLEQSVCQDDWTPVFESLVETLSERASASCSYTIPQPPPGMSFDSAKINVRYAPPGTDPEDVEPWGHVSNLSACADADAWFFDDPAAPAAVLLCSSACERVGASAGGALEVLFGCATIPLE